VSDPPLLSVVVASHDRPRRLGVLLDALAAQTAPPDQWEVVVVHDSSGPATEAVLRDHPLAAAGRLRALRFAAGTGSAARMRNAGWRAAAGRSVAFTDDDCRPDEAWLAVALRAANARPTAILQGSTRPDPRDRDRFGPTSYTLYMDPPTTELEACNAVYPRAVLERVGGFDESIRAFGEDTDLGLRAKRAGAGHLAVPRMRVYHGIHALGLRERLAVAARCAELPAIVRRNPELRWVPHRPLGVFLRPSHAWLVVALAGLALARRRPLLALLALPYARSRLHPYGRTTVKRLRRAHWLAAFAVIDATELLALVRGSVRHRTPML
jgi:GT2 family glycosyltransferase